MKKWITKQVLPVFLSITVIMSASGIPTLAVSDAKNTGQENLCEHHQKHTPDCGYAQALPCAHEHGRECYQIAKDCVHIHTEECYLNDAENENSIPEHSATPSGAKRTEPENCTHICSKESGCITEKLNCHHEHDSECGYTPAISCSYVCAECERKEPPQEENASVLNAPAMVSVLSGKTNVTASGDFSNFHWTLDEEGILTITGTGDMGRRFFYNSEWKPYHDSITKVIIGNGITSIGEYAFENCANLTQAELPDSLTSIGNSSFRLCRSLTSINLPSGLDSIEANAFEECYSLGLIELPNNLTSIGRRAFNACSNLEITKLPDSLTSIGDFAFNQCHNLALAKLPDNLTSIGDYAFSSCGSLALTKLPDSLTSIGDWVFSWCDSLALTKLPDSLTSIGEGAFSGCDSLVLTELPDGLTSIGDYAFNACHSLVLTKLPDSLGSLGEGAFNDCDSLIEITFTRNPAPTLGPKVFYSCDSLTAIYIPAAANGYDSGNWSNYQYIIKRMTLPSFTTQPQDATVVVGQTAAFAMTADGSPAPIYQWQMSKDDSTWENISGAIDSSYTTEAASKNMDGWKYRCIATNNAGNTTSNEATLTVQSTDAGIQAVSVDGTTGTLRGTTITVVLPYGKTPPTDSGKVSITPADGATVSTPATTDNGATWTFTVTAEDGTTTASYTITVSNASNPALGNMADIAAAKSVIESKRWIVGQSTANTENTVKAWMESQIAAMDIKGVKCEISITDFTAAIAGNEANTTGTNGSFIFNISLSKGENDALAKDTITGINGTITAAPHVAQEYHVFASANPTAGGTVSGSGTYTEHTAVTLTATAKEGYRFVKWTEDGQEVSNSVSYTFTIIGNCTFVAIFESDGVSGSGSSSTSNNSGSGSSSDDDSTSAERSKQAKPQIPATGQTQPMTPDAGGNVVIDNGAAQSAIHTAKNNAAKNLSAANGVALVIPITPKGDQNSFNVTIPAQTLDTLIRENVKQLEINIEGVIVGGINAGLLQWMDTASSNRDMILRVKQTALSDLSQEAKTAVGTRPVYDLSLVYLSDQKEIPITDFDGHTISVRLPYAPAKGEQTGNLYAVYVDDKGKAEWLTKSSYTPDFDAVIFETRHLGIYSIGYKTPAPAFTDITNHWAADNIIFAASRGLFSGMDNNQFNPDTGITRGMFLSALGQLEGMATDTAAFSPGASLTREEMAVILANHAKKLGYSLPVAQEAVTFTDHAQINSWAAAEIRALQQAGCLAGKNGNRFDPQGTATRAEAATVLRRFVEAVIDPQTSQGWKQNHSGSWQYQKNGKAATG